MKKPAPKGLKKHKKQIGKGRSKDGESSKKKNPNRNEIDDDEIESVSMEEPQSGNIEQIATEKFQTPEDVKKRIAKNMLEKIQSNTKQNNQSHDDFFMADDNAPPAFEKPQRDNSYFNKEPAEDTYDQEVAQQFKLDHLRKQNKLYEDMTEKFANLEIAEPIEYKGHLQTITAIEVTPKQIFSCSKDRSIIRWDRETGKKDFVSLGKDLQHHRDGILTMAKHTENDNLIATAGLDTLIKLWDVRTKDPIATLKGHRNTINGLKFGINSNIMCSVSKDLTLKEWDISQRGLMETFYEHNNEVLDIDHFNGTDFVTSGNDHQTIVWKTEKQTKIAYKGHDYAIDRVRSINQERFATACMDGSIFLWHVRRSKPVFKNSQAHQGGWICALDSLKQSNVLVSGGTDKVLKVWGIEPEMKGMSCLHEVPMKGFVTDVKVFEDQIVATECEQHRLGRWMTTKTRNKIKIFRLKEKS